MASGGGMCQQDMTHLIFGETRAERGEVTFWRSRRLQWQSWGQESDVPKGRPVLCHKPEAHGNREEIKINGTVT